MQCKADGTRPVTRQIHTFNALVRAHRCSETLFFHSRCTLGSRDIHTELFSSQYARSTTSVHCSSSAPAVDAACLLVQNSRSREDSSCWSRSTASQPAALTALVSLVLVNSSAATRCLDKPAPLFVLSINQVYFRHKSLSFTSHDHTISSYLAPRVKELWARRKLLLAMAEV